MTYGTVRTVLAGGIIASLAATGCAIDFDAPFAETNSFDKGDASPPDASDATQDQTEEIGADGDPGSSCTDGLLNGTESDTDCGGQCQVCTAGQRCGTAADCEDGYCVDGVCCTESCSDVCYACSEAKSGAPDGTCAPVIAGTDPDDRCPGAYVCQTGICESCSDGLRNGDEDDVDCGGGCPSCGEICTNGSDDDGNGLVDCQDPACGSFICLPEVPSEWQGPAWLNLGATTPLDCVGDSIAVGGVGTPLFDLPECSACSCATPVGQVCSNASIDFYYLLSCSGAPLETVTTPAPDVCTSLTEPQALTRARSQTSSPTGGTCSASGGIATLGPVAWPERAQLCSGVSEPGGGCDNGRPCVQLPPAGYHQELCIYRAGDISCPDPNDTRFVLFQEISDTRKCSACSCSSPGGVCEGTFSLYDDPFCSGHVADVSTDDVCVKLPLSFSYESVRFDGQVAQANCTASGGVAGGKVEGTQPLTICCR